jgi:hypothetical protein
MCHTLENTLNFSVTRQDTLLNHCHFGPKKRKVRKRKSGERMIPQKQRPPCETLVGSFLFSLSPHQSCELAHLPFHVNVTHLFPCEAEVIQDHIFGVPDNTTQEKPGGKKNNSNLHTFPTKEWDVLI